MVATRRNVIDASLVPGMTLRKAANGQPASFYYPVFCDGLLGVTGTAGVKPAVVTKERAQQYLVAGNEVDKEATHQGFLPWLGLDAWRVSFCHCCRNIVDSSALSN